MRKFIFALLLGLFFIGTMVSENSKLEKEAPDICMVMQMDAPDAFQSAISFELKTSADVGWQSTTTNITYTAKPDKPVMLDNHLYRYDVEINNTTNTIRPPDIYKLV